MGNHTVNKKEYAVKKEEYTDGAAGYKEDTSITIMMFHPELIRIMSDNAKKQEVCKLVEDKDILYQTEEYVAVRVFGNKEKNSKKEKAKPVEGEHEI